jgi:hypothetical protein
LPLPIAYISKTAVSTIKSAPIYGTSKDDVVNTSVPVVIGFPFVNTVTVG